MSEASPRPPRRRLRGFLALFATLLLLVLVAAATLPWWLDARRVAGLVLDRASASTGLSWSIDGEPALRWRPAPWLALPGLSVRNGEGRLLVQAARLEVAVPWSTLRGDALRIDALRLIAPRIDLETALAWWKAQPSGTDAGLPDLAGIELVDGEVSWSGGLASAVQARLPRLSVGEAFDLELAARIALDEGPAPFDARLSLHARLEDAPLRLEAMALGLSGSGPVPTLDAKGRLQPSPWAAEVGGTLASWPEPWPALPPPIGSAPSPIAFSISQAGADVMSARALLHLSRPGASLQLEGVPADVLAWSKDAKASPLPPLVGRAEMPRLDIDGVPMEGVSLEITESDGERP